MHRPSRTGSAPRSARMVRAGVALGLSFVYAVGAVGQSGVTAPPLPPPRPDRVPSPEVVAPGAETSAPGTCPERLTRLGVRFERRPDLREGSCGATDVVVLSGLPDGIEVSPASTMTCPVAEALARWTLEVVSAEANRHLGDPPVKIVIGTSYQCRNQRSGGKPSEHAFANAVDLMSFGFAKRPPLTIDFHKAGSPEEAFQRAAQKGACAYFTTVLGPGSDAAHGNHLHLDLRGRKGGYRICQ